MLFLINRRYPILGAVLSAISNVVFLALGVAHHSTLLIAMSAADRTGSTPARPEATRGSAVPGLTSQICAVPGSPTAT